MKYIIDDEFWNSICEQAKVVKEIPDKGFRCLKCGSENVVYVVVEDDGYNHEKCNDCGYRWRGRLEKTEEDEEEYEYGELAPWILGDRYDEYRTMEYYEYGD